MQKIDLSRYLEAQEKSFDSALKEIKNGRKQSHWMWYIFPQIQGLGFSETSKFYALKDFEEAKAYLEHPLLGSRLIEISRVLLDLPQTDPNQIFGSPDDMKLKSSMTLFSLISTDSVFDAVLKKFFNEERDEKTLAILNAGSF